MRNPRLQRPATQMACYDLERSWPAQSYDGNRPTAWRSCQGDDRVNIPCGDEIAPSCHELFVGRAKADPGSRIFTAG